MDTAMRIILTSASLSLLLTASATGQTSSPNFRLEGAGFVAVSVESSSPSYTAELTGGDGSPVGETSSPSFETSSGTGQTQLPTERIFTSTFE